MAGMLLVFGWRYLSPYLRERAPQVFDVTAIGRMIRVGTPIGTQMLLEWGAFGTVALLMGSLGTIQMAAHQVAINLASLTSFVDNIEVAAYSAAKNAVLGLTRSCANEWAKHGIRTNAIAPGVVVTDLNRKNIENNDRGRRIIERTPAARFGTPEEIAGTAVYLASPAASFVNGQAIVVDGGFLACGFGDSFVQN